MRRTKPRVMMFMAPIAMALMMGLAGCVAGYADGGPEWDGPVFVGGGYYGGDRGYHPQAFHAESGRHTAAAGSARGRASMGARAGGHAASGGHRK
jgi:hypothetical protein